MRSRLDRRVLLDKLESGEMVMNVKVPPEYIERRDADRAEHPYRVEVDENLLTIKSGRSKYSDEGSEGLTIPLPFIRGIGSINKHYTGGRGSAVDLMAFSVTMTQGTSPFVIYQGEPVWGWSCGLTEAEQVVLQAEEMKWHKQQLAILRHDVLAALNAYIDLVRELDPQNRQLKLGF